MGYTLGRREQRMKKLNLVLAVLVILSLVLTSSALYARGPRVYIGGYFGFPYYPYPYSYPPYAYPYYYPPVYAYPSYPYAYAQPPVYSAPEQPYYWYYCQDPQGYYPYVKNCPAGWIKVIPTPPQPREEGMTK
jgi:hypothetical protein